MKRVLIFIFIFWLLVFMSSFSWAQSNTLYVNTSVVNSPVGNIDLYSYYVNDFSYNNIPWYDMTSCVIRFETEANFTTIYLSNGSFYYDSNFNHISCTEYMYAFNFDVTTYQGSNQSTYISFDNSYDIVGNAIYSDNTLSSFYTSTNVYGDDTSFFENAFNYDSEGGSGEGGSGDGGEGEDSSFISSLADMLIHIVVPTSEQWEDLQDSFENNIMNKFSLITMSFNDDLTYNFSRFRLSNNFSSLL